MTEEEEFQEIEDKEDDKARVFLSDIESIFGDTIVRVAEIHDQMQLLRDVTSFLPELKLMINTVASAQTTMAQSAQSWAETFRKAEVRSEKQEQRHDLLSQTLAGKDQIPLKSHYWTVMICMVPTMVMALGVVLGVLYVTRQDLKASLTDIQVNQSKTQQIVKDAQKELQEAVDKVSPDNKEDAK